MTFIDTHSHIYLEEFAKDLPQVIERAQATGISHILLPNIDSTTVESMLNVCSLYGGYCFPMMGLHPTFVNGDFEKELSVVEEQLAGSGKYIAVGEVGLDLYWDKTFLKEQIIAFDRQIQWALKYDLPLVIHSREAFEPLCDTLLPYKDTSLKGIFHSFTGTSLEAARLLDFENFMLGINGVVTFKKSGLADVVKDIPLNRITVETDAPYLTPVPYRGKRNESSYLKFTLEKLAEIYQLAPDHIARETTKSALKIFSKIHQTIQ